MQIAKQNKPVKYMFTISMEEKKNYSRTTIKKAKSNKTENLNLQKQKKKHHFC